MKKLDIIFLLVVNVLIVSQSDDLTRAWDVMYYGDPITAYFNWYLSFDPRFGNLIHYIIVSLHPVIFIPIVTALQYWAFTQFTGDFKNMVPLYLTMTPFATIHIDSVFWMAGFTNYLLSFAILLRFLKTKNPYWGLVCGMCNYLTVFPVLVYFFLNNWPIKKAVTWAIGVLILAVSPGNFNRAAKINTEHDFFDVWGNISTMPISVLKFIVYISPILLVAFLFKDRAKLQWLFLSLVCVCMMMFTPAEIFRNRYMMIPYGFALMSIVHIVQYWKIWAYARLILYPSYIICTIWFSSLCLNGNINGQHPISKWYNYYNSDLLERIAVFENCEEYQKQWLVRLLKIKE